MKRDARKGRSAQGHGKRRGDVRTGAKGEYKKKSVPAVYSRKLSIDELLAPAHQQPMKSDQLIEMVVRGMHKGEIRLEDQEKNAYACRKERAMGALHGDRVLAERIGRETAVVRRVIERAHQTMVGVLFMNKHGVFLEPMERHLPTSIEVDGPLYGAKEGDVVRAEVVRWEHEGGLLCRVGGVIGSFDKASTALDALVVSAHLRSEFPKEALDEAAALRPAPHGMDGGREDLRGLLSFTIDGRDAKDFDDAVSLEEMENGHLLLGVHIADVGHYVPQGSALDKEAYLRGTSVYLPGRVLPMLPEALSNGVCSLRPGEDKFTMSALIELTREGEIVAHRVVRSLTRSDARLVYDDVNAFFAGDAVQAQRLEEMHPQLGCALQKMRALASAIRRRRQAQGCIDFETAEPKFILDDAGEPVEIVTRERGEAELLIEDFMLTANECVARMAREKGLPLLYRVHEKPDPEKLRIFRDFLAAIGVDVRVLGHGAKPGEIRAILEETKERPEAMVISALALRSMQKARYDAQPLGHFGLAMSDYCHFTSPIRRYPDLVVSRALTAMLTGGRVPLKGDALADAAIRSSDCERAAAEAERMADKLMMARYMASHVGESYEGTVSGVSEWGVYVSLPNGAEGFMHVRTLEDWFEYDERRMTLRGERTGAVFSLGQALTVRVADVELTAGLIDLELTGPLRGPNAKREKSERKKERERMRGFSR
ncbi:MAG: ribonuclease R [Clostridia bacterium]|nr:ribonuclease R [Clostridia bacterium]